MQISLAQINTLIGDFEGNLEKILQYIEIARSEGSDLVVFPELSTCGYPPRDFLEFSDFIAQSAEVLDKIRLAASDIAVLVGSPAINPVIEGKDLHNAAFFIADQKIIFQHNKTLLPTYDIFDEYRYFEPSHDLKVFDYHGFRIALTVCEDLWNLGNENPIYTVCPMDKMIDQLPDLIFNISASPFAYDHAQERIDVVRANVLKYKLPLFYCNAVGAQTDIVFDGGSLVFDGDGFLYDELPYFEECIRTYSIEKNQPVRRIDHSYPDPVGPQPKEKYKLIHDALVLGIRDYFGKLGFTKAVLGLSGGIDSALTCALAVRALGKENVMGLMMPSRYSSKGSVEDAVALATNLDIRYQIIEIEPMYDRFLTQLSPILEDRPFNVTEENIQARIRGTLLMATSNKLGPILLNTTNKSEMSVGYGTLYGDLCGGLSVLGDVYKTEVYRLVQYINGGEGVAGVIPQNSITKPPSAELRPGQKDSDSLPPYDILDTILYQYVEKRKGPDEIIAMGYDATLVKRILKMVNINEFKREQTAPVIRVSPKAFGVGRRMPIVGKYLG